MGIKHWVTMGMLFAAAPALAGVERTGEASAVFNGKGPGGFKLEGKTNELTLKDDGKTVVFTVPLANLKTGIDLRDRHMREKYLEVAQYPDVVLEVPWEQIKLPEDGKSITQTVKGQVTLHGQKKEVPVEYTITRTGDDYAATGKMPLNLEAHGIKTPGYLGVTVKPDIDTVTSFHFKKT